MAENEGVDEFTLPGPKFRSKNIASDRSVIPGVREPPGEQMQDFLKRQVGQCDVVIAFEIAFGGSTAVRQRRCFNSHLGR